MFRRRVAEIVYNTCWFTNSTSSINMSLTRILYIKIAHSNWCTHTIKYIDSLIGVGGEGEGFLPSTN